MIERYSPGSVPKKLFAEARVLNGSLTADYRVDWRRDTGSPLCRIESGDGRELFQVRFTGSWYADLEARTLQNCDAVACHGITRIPPDSREEINTASHWYIHPHDRDCLVVSHRYYRQPPALREVLGAGEGMHLQPAGDRLIRMDGGEAVVVLDGEVAAQLAGTVSGDSPAADAVRLEMPGQRYGYIVATGSLAEGLLIAPHLSISIEPDTEQAGSFVTPNEAHELKVTITAANEPFGLGEIEVSVYGAWQGRQRVRMDAGGARTVFKGLPGPEGLLPLLVLVQGRDFLVAKTFEVLVLPTVLESSDPRFNGVFAEHMRSILMRKFWNVVPEDEARGATSYPHFFYPRNFTSYNLCAFGFPDLGLAHLEAYAEILLRDGFLAQDYDLKGQSGNLLSGEPSALMIANANDGIGFYLFQLAKCLFRHPEAKVNFGGVDQAIR